MLQERATQDQGYEQERQGEGNRMHDKNQGEWNCQDWNPEDLNVDLRNFLLYRQ